LGKRQRRRRIEIADRILGVSSFSFPRRNVVLALSSKREGENVRVRESALLWMLCIDSLAFGEIICLSETDDERVLKS